MGLRALAVFALLLFVLPRSPAFGWNEAGHATVALIAWRRLPPKTRDRVLALLRKHPGAPAWGVKDDESILAKAASWPDEIRRKDHPFHADHRAEDHYINLPAAVPPDYPLREEQTLAAVVARPNIVTRLQQSVAVMKNDLVEESVRARELSWIFHLVGDIHQPLHCSGVVSKRFPQGDRGGNWALVAPAAREVEPTELTDPPRLPNLHAYWDDLLGVDARLETVRRLAEEAVEVDPKVDAKSFKPEAWAWEGFRLAVGVAYADHTLEVLPAPEAIASLRAGKKVTIPALPPGYEEKARAVARKQAALAGARLAALLVELFGE
jgi:hypothetical protein